MKKNLIILLVLLSAVSLCFGDQVTKVGTTVANFLNIEPGARAVAMGGAYVAVAEGAETMFWNPAGMARLSQVKTTFNHANWIADMSHNYAGIAMPLPGFGVLGVNAAFFTMEDMQITTIQDPDGVPNGFFSAGSYAVAVSYATMLTDRFSIGGNAKIINEHIASTNATGFAFDVGTLFDTPFNGLKIGMSISNYGSKMQLSGKDLLTQKDIDEENKGNNPNINAYLGTEKYDLPLMFRVGVAMDVLKGMGNSNLVLAVDALHPNNNAESLNLGCEYKFMNMVSLRAGYNTLFLPDDETGLSLGAGVQYKVGASQLGIDYAYRDFGVLKDIQMFTISLGF